MLSKKIDSLEDAAIYAKSLKGVSSTISAHAILLVSTAAIYDASAKTADDKDVFIGHILADIAA